MVESVLMSQEWNAEERRIFHNSLERCIETRIFLDKFYDLFVNSSTEIQKKFANTDFRKQKHALKVSFYMILLASDGKPEGFAHLDRIASLHSQAHLDINPEYYVSWRDCLIQAVRECDPKFNEAVESTWIKMANIGIDYLTSRYHSIKP
jgi:hemoglobin-like flavoprotein